MSHFSVLVIGEDVEGQLAPYDENIRVDPYPEPLDEEEVARARSFAEKSRDSEGAPGPDASDEDVLAWWLGDDQPPVFEGGKWYRMSTYNPRSKWDWFQIGGRWHGKLMVKGKDGNAPEGALLHSPSWGWEEGELEKYHQTAWAEGAVRVDQARKGDIAWDVMSRVVRRDAERTWDRAVAEEDMTEETRSLIYGILPDESREEYADRVGSRSFTTYALVREGEWYEKGKMGWWGVSDDEFTDEEWQMRYAELLNDLPDDALLTVVDCHI